MHSQRHRWVVECYRELTAAYDGDAAKALLDTSRMAGHHNPGYTGQKYLSADDDHARRIRDPQPRPGGLAGDNSPQSRPTVAQPPSSHETADRMALGRGAHAPLSSRASLDARGSASSLEPRDTGVWHGSTTAAVCAHHRCGDRYR